MAHFNTLEIGNYFVPANTLDSTKWLIPLSAILEVGIVHNIVPFVILMVTTPSHTSFIMFSPIVQHILPVEVVRELITELATVNLYITWLDTYVTSVLLD